jgi:hypothetical protein
MNIIKNTDVSGSGYINNAMTVDEIANNAKFQMGNIEYYLSIKNYESALIKANCLVSELQDIMALQIGSELFKPDR